MVSDPGSLPLAHTTVTNSWDTTSALVRLKALESEQEEVSARLRAAMTDTADTLDEQANTCREYADATTMRTVASRLRKAASS